MSTVWTTVVAGISNRLHNAYLGISSLQLLQLQFTKSFAKSYQSSKYKQHVFGRILIDVGGVHLHINEYRNVTYMFTSFRLLTRLWSISFSREERSVLLISRACERLVLIGFTNYDAERDVLRRCLIILFLLYEHHKFLKIHLLK